MTTRLEKKIGVEDVFSLYLSTDNAMEAELSFGVSVVPVITQKNKIPNKNKANINSVEKSEKFEQVHKRLQKIIFYLRKNNP